MLQWRIEYLIYKGSVLEQIIKVENCFYFLKLVFFFGSGGEKVNKVKKKNK